MKKVINLYEINEVFKLSNSDEFKLAYLIDIVGMDATRASNFVSLWNSIKMRNNTNTPNS